MRQLTDIETINAEYNSFTKLPEATWVDGPWGVAKGDSEEITVYPDSLSGAYVLLSVEEARSLGAALLTITKEVGEPNE